jgi:hypothetical protein
MVLVVDEEGSACGRGENRAVGEGGGRDETKEQR